MDLTQRSGGGERGGGGDGQNYQHQGAYSCAENNEQKMDVIPPGQWLKAGKVLSSNSTSRSCPSLNTYNTSSSNMSSETDDFHSSFTPPISHAERENEAWFHGEGALPTERRGEITYPIAHADDPFSSPVPRPPTRRLSSRLTMGASIPTARSSTKRGRDGVSDTKPLSKRAKVAKDAFENTDMLMEDPASPVYNEKTKVKNMLHHQTAVSALIGTPAGEKLAAATPEELNTAIARFQENGREGRYDEVWRTQAVTASVSRDQGAFDAFEQSRFVSNWAEENAALSDAENEGATEEGDDEDVIMSQNGDLPAASSTVQEPSNPQNHNGDFAASSGSQELFNQPSRIDTLISSINRDNFPAGFTREQRWNARVAAALARAAPNSLPPGHLISFAHNIAHQEQIIDDDLADELAREYARGSAQIQRPETPFEPNGGPSHRK